MDDDDYAVGVVTIPAETFVRDNKSYLNDPAFSDFTIRDDLGAVYRVHRNVISNHSKYFDKLCRGEFKESTAGAVTLHDHPPEAVRFMIDFFYIFDYISDTSGTSRELGFHAWRFTIADKYEVLDLKALALRKFDSVAVNLCVRGSKCDNAFLEAVTYIYANTPPNDDSLRRAAVRMWTYYDNNATMSFSKEQWEDMLSKNPAFGADLLRYMAGMKSKR